MSELTATQMIKELRADNPYLGFADLEPESRVTVKISKIVDKHNVTSAKGKKYKTVFFLGIENTDRLHWLTVSKLAFLKELFGNNTSDWLGKSLVFYADPTVLYRGEEVGGIVFEEARNANHK